MTRHANAFYIRLPEGLTWKEKSRPTHGYIAQLQVTQHEESSSTSFFLKAIKRRGPRSYHGMLRRRTGQLDVPLDIRILRGRKTGDARGDATCSLAEFSLERDFFLERSDHFMISSRKQGEKTAWQQWVGA